MHTDARLVGFIYIRNIDYIANRSIHAHGRAKARTLPLVVNMDGTNVA